jgi:hypothetical protein
MSLQTWNTRKQYDKKSKNEKNVRIFSLFNFLFFHIFHIFSLFNLPFFQFRVFILTMSFSSAFIVCFARTYSCWFRMFIRKLSVLQVHIVVGSKYSWAIMTNLGHITGPLWRHPFINTIMLILLSQNEQGISELDLQKHIFPSGSSPMKNTFLWMQRHRVNYYKGEQIAWNKPIWNSLNTPAYEHNAWSQIGRFRKVSWHIYYRFPVLKKELSLLTIYGSWCTRKYIGFFSIFETKHLSPNVSKK